MPVCTGMTQLVQSNRGMYFLVAASELDLLICRHHDGGLLFSTAKKEATEDSTPELEFLNKTACPKYVGLSKKTNRF
jgi:hypothetical protein